MLLMIVPIAWPGATGRGAGFEGPAAQADMVASAAAELWSLRWRARMHNVRCDQVPVVAAAAGHPVAGMRWSVGQGEDEVEL